MKNCPDEFEVPRLSRLRFDGVESGRRTYPGERAISLNIVPPRFDCLDEERERNKERYSVGQREEIAIAREGRVRIAGTRSSGGPRETLRAREITRLGIATGTEVISGWRKTFNSFLIAYSVGLINTLVSRVPSDCRLFFSSSIQELG